MQLVIKLNESIRLHKRKNNENHIIQKDFPQDWNNMVFALGSDMTRGYSSQNAQMVKTFGTLGNETDENVLVLLGSGWTMYRFLTD